VTLDAETIIPWAAERGLPTDRWTLAHHPEVHDLVQPVVDEANPKHATVARIKKFALLDQDFSIETGELTPTLKIKQTVVTTKFADAIDRLYDAIG
jgi:long-chain acyl-CoA synthetase